jgi:hypothetical protein
MLYLLETQREPVQNEKDTTRQENERQGLEKKAVKGQAFMIDDCPQLTYCLLLFTYVHAALTSECPSIMIGAEKYQREVGVNTYVSNIFTTIMRQPVSTIKGSIPLIKD